MGLRPQIVSAKPSYSILAQRKDFWSPKIQASKYENGTSPDYTIEDVPQLICWRLDKIRLFHAMDRTR